MTAGKSIYFVLCCCAKTPSCPSQAFPSTSSCFLIEHTTTSQNTQLGDSRIFLGGAEQSGAASQPCLLSHCSFWQSEASSPPEHRRGNLDQGCRLCREETDRTASNRGTLLAQHARGAQNIARGLEHTPVFPPAFSHHLIPHLHGASLRCTPKPEQLVRNSGKQRLTLGPLPHGYQPRQEVCWMAVAQVFQ